MRIGSPRNGGKAHGVPMGMVKALMKNCTDGFGIPSEANAQKLLDQLADLPRLKELIDRFFDAESWEELLGDADLTVAKPMTLLTSHSDT